ncbi:MAG: hypothetical protein JSU63_04395 [Phycisphaerales bacterium]|nr:MAG: hypothetical protein JSU63_04395 [Phycisphaerales bacterium]
MRNLVVLTIAACFLTTAAMAVDLELSVESGGSNSVTVQPGDPVSYSVEGTLINTSNRGLALVGFDLELVEAGSGTQAGSLAQTSTPAGMGNFAVPDGLNNPAGYGGTDDAGKLLQVGGAQNTINNTVDCVIDDDCPGASNLCIDLECTASAPFPVGTVIENIGHTQETLATGTLTAPGTDGTYMLKLTDAFANVIASDQSGSDLYWATESVDPANIAVTNLTITVSASGGCETGAITWNNPMDGTVDARQPRDINNGAVLQGIDTFDVSGPASADNLDCWTLCETVVEGTANSIGSIVDDGRGNYTITLNRRISPGAVTTLTYTPDAGAASTGTFTSLPADSSADGVSNTADILSLIDCCLNAVCTPAWGVYSCDIDQSAVVNTADILRLIDLLNGAGQFVQPWNLASPVTTGCP